uniref:Uncharacterized protein n=1 Tax=Suricata suricatta TaxID=37032 RepID=A0A673SWH5_SURSU
VPGGLEKACHRCVLKIASNSIPLTVGLHQAEAACGHGRGDG